MTSYHCSFQNINVNTIFSLDNSLSDKYSVKLYIDQNQIQHVLINLILNSIQASTRGQRIDIGTIKEKEKITFFVKDYCIGIAQNSLKNAFEPFYSTKKDGKGLGLYISNYIVQQNHNGSLEISTKEGKGTEVRVNLPIETEKELQYA